MTSLYVPYFVLVRATRPAEKTEGVTSMVSSGTAGRKRLMSCSTLRRRLRLFGATNFSLELRVAYPLVVANIGCKALARHVPVVVAGHRKRRHDALHLTVVVVHFVFNIALFIGRISPSECLLYWQVIRRIQVESYTFIVRVHNRNLIRGFPLCNGLALVEQRHTRLQNPFSKHPVECVVPSPQIISQILGLLWARALVSDFVSPIAVVHIDYVALFCELNALFIGKFIKAPENDS